jgi:hypothetical protein
MQHRLRRIMTPVVDVMSMCGWRCLSYSSSTSRPWCKDKLWCKTRQGHSRARAWHNNGCSRAARWCSWPHATFVGTSTLGSGMLDSWLKRPLAQAWWSALIPCLVYWNSLAVLRLASQLCTCFDVFRLSYILCYFALNYSCSYWNRTSCVCVMCGGPSELGFPVGISPVLEVARTYLVVLQGCKAGRQ